MAILLDRVQQATTTTGTGTYTLGSAVTGFRTFNSQASVGDVIRCVVEDGVGGYEVGDYTLGTNTLARTTIIESSNSNAAVNWGSGTKNIYSDATARDVLPNQTSNSGKILTTDGTTPSWTSSIPSLSLSGGTANGVLYLNGSKAVTSGSALTFDGTNLNTTGGVSSGSGTGANVGVINKNIYTDGYSSDSAQFRVFMNHAGTGLLGMGTPAGGDGIIFGRASSNSGAVNNIWATLNNTGLGIGTSSPAYKLDVNGTTRCSLLIVSSGSSGYMSSFDSTNANGGYFTLSTSGTVYGDIGTAAQAVGGSASDFALNARGARNLVFGTNNTERMRLDSAGNLGIGKSNPAYKLDLYGGALNINNGSSAGTIYFVDGAGYINYASSTMQFSVNGSERMRLDSAGNLGLGVTPSGWGSNYKSFEMGNAGYGITSAVSSGYVYTVQNTYNNGTNWVYKSNGTASQSVTKPDGFIWNLATSGTAGNAISFTQAMTLDASGNLTLATGSLNSQFWAGINATSMVTSGSGSWPLLFGINGTEKMRLDSAGNLGLGVTPSAWTAGGNIQLSVSSKRAITTSGTVINLGTNWYYASGTGDTYIGTAAATNYSQDAGLHKWFTALSGTAGTAISWLNNAPVMTLDVSGNLHVPGGGGISTNEAFGTGALKSNTTGYQNSAVGMQALYLNTTGVQNSAVGFQTLYANTTGNYNSAMGVNALFSNTTASYNSALGFNALASNTTGAQNSAVGQNALSSNTTGSNNSAVGQVALQNNTTGSSNSAVGQGALQNNTTASNNTAVGYQAGYSNTTGTANVFNGYQAGYGSTGSHNIGIGGNDGSYYSPLRFNSGNYNTALGNGALGQNTTGSNNSAVGYQAGYSNTTGVNNSAMGYQALYYNTTGYFNSSMGNGALYSNTTGYSNSAMGVNALYSNTTGNSNTAVGYQAGYSNTTGGVTAFGYSAGSGVTTGSIVAIGVNAGNNLTTGSNGIYIGTNTQPSAVSNTYEIVIGTGSTGKGSSTGFINPNGGGVYQGNNSASWSTTSDARIKENVVDLASGLSVVNALRPVEFDYIETKKHDIGWLAQEFAEVLPDQVSKHAANQFEKELVGEDEIYGINPNLIPYLVKAIQEQQAIIESLQADIAILKGK